jgi:hypothetical protein
MGLIKLNRTLWDKTFTIYKQDGSDKIAFHVVDVKDLRKALGEYLDKIQVPDEYIEGCNGSDINKLNVKHAKEVFGELMFM